MAMKHVLVILLIQMEQMVGEEVRYSLIAYLWGILLLMVSFTIPDLFNQIGAVLIAVALIGMGWIDQTIGLAPAGEKVRAEWREWSAAREEDEGMEGMDSVSK